ncbi:MAG TPA: prepilin-type N-terminal cleavage/methylation domain-containing protein [Terriglobales bacterium]|jgi:Tfp pilus assembly protein PilV|nr:prepilin-type N-terminal cleavage/methylation domain-containing protein [Terriglobales bacterium]
MVRTIMTKRSHSGTKPRQKGFALLETLIAIVVLMIGLLAVLATFALAIGNTSSVQNDSIARQKAAEAIESIYTARQTSQITFDEIQNQGTGNGIFKVGFTAMTDPGPDGLDNTADDTTAQPIRLPGQSGVITNSAADVFVDLGNFTRQVQIADVPGNPNVRQITVNVRYPVPQGWFRTYQLQALISSYR